MKKIWLLALTCVTIVACSDDKAEEKKSMDGILATHDKVMAAEDKAMTNKIQIDSLLKLDKFAPQDSAALKAEFRTQSSNLKTADEAMEDWMHKFDPDYKGKSHADVMEYLNTQNIQINKIDSQLNSSIDLSTKALAKYKQQ
ncbi:hypothetical protein [Mucilaginibacter agri]|uniref:Lipoprotein n=1 Tax=Mucilaginibacter agri TaxID=2695265 RepID=A0A965ZIL0_9SPHI|nr:hypothetical protein [Mucilaginibacter agri]NCD71779.1 hypothetical protein [Mucilaginibacter agri]